MAGPARLGCQETGGCLGAEILPFRHVHRPTRLAHRKQERRKPLSSVATTHTARAAKCIVLGMCAQHTIGV